MARGAQRLLAVGGSAGGVEALSRLVAGLPADLDAGVVVTVHTSPHARSHLPEILGRAGPLHAVHARTGEPLLPGRIHVAPPGMHLMVDHGRALLSSGPRVNRHRPSIDVMLASAARWAGPRVVAAVLSGVLDDGAVGAALVSQAGGRVVVQDPGEAAFPGMPQAALDATPGARAVPTADLGAVLTSLLDVEEERVVQHGAAVGAVAPGGILEVVGMEMADGGDPVFLAPGEARLTRLVCPECQGSLAQVDLPQISYFRCHVGHEYAPQTLAAAQADTSEAKLWTAVAALEEQAALSRHLAEHAGSRGTATADDRGTGARDVDDAGLRSAADRATELAEVLRSHLQSPPQPDAAA